jgi:hypothetical protein
MAANNVAKLPLWTEIAKVNLQYKSSFGNCKPQKELKDFS